MTFAVVCKPNPLRLPVGAWLERDDDGYQKVEVESRENRMQVKRSVGVIIPHRELDAFVTRPTKWGFKRWQREF